MTSLRNSIAALAVSLPMLAAAQAAPAPATPPLYQWYGTMNVNAQWTMAKGATARGTAGATNQSVPARIAVSVDSTNIGIRGAADIAHGYQVVYQCETTAALDIGGTGLCNRNSRLGVSAFWGTLFYGNWDTPYKSMAYGTKADDPFGNTDVFGFNSILSNPGFRTQTATWTGATAGTKSFDIRANNSIAYWTPKFMGASLKVQYSADESKTQRGDPAGVGYLTDPTLYAVGANYDFGPLSIAAAWERHYDGAGLTGIGSGFIGGTAPTTANAARGTDDKGVRVAAGVELPLPMGVLGVQAMWERLMYNAHLVAGLGDGIVYDYQRDAVELGAKFRMGNHEFRARYEYADAGKCKGNNGTPCHTNGFGASSATVGYGYQFTKAAQGYLFYTRIDNERNASYVFTTGGSTVVTTGLPTGADPQAAGVGMRYAF